LKCGFQNEVYSSKAPTSFSRGPLAVSLTDCTRHDRTMIIIFLIAYIVFSYFLTRRVNKFYSTKLNSKLKIQTLTIATFLLLVVFIPYLTTIIVRQSFFSETLTKTIDKKYYFTQQDYFYPLDGGGKRILIYKDNDYWFDENILDIELQAVYDTFDVKIENQIDDNMKRIKFISNNQTQFDTTLNFNKFTKFRHVTY
jgi:hypothetical protein